MMNAYDQAFATVLPAIPGIEESPSDIPMRDGHIHQSLLIKPSSTTPTSTTTISAHPPLIVLYFGGGFMLGSPATMAPYARAFAHFFDAVVLSANYRLAPEDPFPAAPHDAWDTLRWAAAHASSLGADPDAGFVVGGASAGGTLAGVMAQLAKDEGLRPALTGQWLCIPLLFEEGIVPEKYKAQYLSREQCTDHRVGLERVRTQYAFEERSPLFSPVNGVSGLGGLPRMYAQVCGKDPLRDDGLIYERMLRESGVETVVDVYPGVPHAHWLMYPGLKASQKFMCDMVKGMGWLLGKEADGAEVERLLKLPPKIM